MSCLPNALGWQGTLSITQTAPRAYTRRTALEHSRPASAGARAPAARAEADILGKLAALLGVIGRHHRIIGRQAPALAILLGRQIVGRLEVALQHFEFLAVLETNEMVRMNRFLDRNRRLRPLHRRHRRLADIHKRLVNLIDELRQVGDANRIVRHMRSNDFGRERQQVFWTGIIAHDYSFPPPPSLCIYGYFSTPASYEGRRFKNKLE